tara:strand:- start:4000 stop:10041 length:6042 start_codon:yes stop_codon:yes gene_type:complete
MVDNKDKTSIPLLLGDIIKITSPTNDILNDQTFIIDFINQERVVLINTSTLEPSTIQIQEDGVFGDGSVTDISLVYRNKEKGYARQNKLLPGVWVNINFGGDIPTIITGQITDLEEDMIELKSHPGGEIIYLNFNYSGIPDDIPIDLIEIRKSPDDIKVKEDKKIKIPSEEDNSDDDEREIDEELDYPSDFDKISTKSSPETDFNIQSIPTSNVKDELEKVLLEANDVVFSFGEEFAPIEQFVEKDTAKVRYSIEAQCNDLLDEMLSTIPNSERTRRILREIHTIIERFKQLRTQFSKLDQNGNVLSPLKKEADWKPLSAELYDFNKKLYWLLPVAKNVKKVFNVTGEIEDLPSDIVTLNTMDEMMNLQQEMDLYKSNSFPDGQNKYIHLIKNIINEQIPFQQDNFEDSSNILYTNLINNNLNVVIDNLGYLYSSVVDHNNVNSKRFLIQKYNLGMKTIVASKLDKSNMTFELTDITDNNTISIRSLLTLPEPVVRFSSINLPKTDILRRANLNEHFIQYWQLLNNSTKVQTINLADNKYEMDENKFLNNVKNYIFRLEDEAEDDKRGNYDKFVEKFIPRTKQLFQMTKKYMRRAVSLSDVLKDMEPFLIYNDDLTFKQYEEITKFVFNEISNHLKKFVERSHAFFKLISMKPNVPKNPSTEAIYQAPNKLSKTVFKDGYDYDGELKLTNSELLAKVIGSDSAKLFNSAISFENLKLMYPNEIAKLFENSDATNKQLLEEFSNKNDCQVYNLAKQYSTMEQMEQDNNKDIYYDKKFDKTMYSILDNYDKEMATKDPDEFIDFLVRKLEKTQKLSTDEALYLSETLISGMKLVREGDYAFIFDIVSDTNNENQNAITYFKRVNNVWVEDDSVDKSMFINDDDILCNIHTNCMKVQDNCETTDLNKTKLEGNDLKQIMNEFDQKYAFSKDQLEFKIRENLEYYESTIKKLTEVRMKDKFKYNNQQMTIGASLNDTDAFSTISSPYSVNLSKIIGQGDFVKKQNDIIKFTMQFTRKALVGTDESPFWRYCIKTNTPLMPEFRYTLASAFVENPNNYQRTVEILKSTIGKISDDGNAWVDAHSGQVIQVDNLEFEDVYVDGFKDVSNAIMEKDAAQQVIGTLKQQGSLVKQPLEMKMANNIVDAFSSNMGINLEDQREFIIELAIRTFHMNMDDEDKYKKRVMKASKENKTLPSYKEYYNARILYYTMAAYIIGVQSNIPSIVTRRTFPGCVTSFKGFPFEGAGDDSAINYISCIAYNIRNSNDPWNVLKKKKQSSIAEALKRTIQEKFIEQPEVKNSFMRKAEYLLTAPSENIPDELNPLLTWKRFIPPLYPFKTIKLSPLTTEFKAKLLSDLKSGYGGQEQDLLVVESKIIHYSLGIQERIQNIVAKQVPILKNMTNDPFLENACCSTTNEGSNVLSYFIQKDKEIEVYNNIVKQMGLTLKDVDVITRALLFYSPINTKTVYPPLKNEFSEYTIYTAFIVYCKFNTILPIPENLVKFCNEKPENIQPNETMKEMIIKLKNDGRNYDGVSLIQLFQLVSREHMVQLPVTLPTTDYIQCIRNILKGETDDDNEDVEPSYVDPEFKKFMEDNIETFSMVNDSEEDETREFKNFLALQNRESKNALIDFLSQYTSKTQFNKNKIEKRLDAIFTFREREISSSDSRLDISDAYGYNIINTMKVFADNFIQIYPNIIMNEVDFENTIIPSYLGLSNIHTIDLKNIINEEFEKLKGFYSKKPIYNVLKTVGDRCEELYKLMNNTPYFSQIEYNGNIKQSIFNERLTMLLYEYYVLEILKMYMELTNDETMIYVEEDETKNMEDIFTVESLDDTNVQTNVMVQIENTDLLFEGNKKVLKRNIADLLLVYLELLHTSIDIVSISYDDVMDTVFKLKEAEKKTFTDKLSKMTIEQRNVDTVMKINKLGDWGKGLKSGITRYDSNLYDEEKEMMEHILNVEKELIQNNDNVNERNKNQYIDDFMSQQRIDDIIDNEANDMEHMNDDYDDGHYGADELDYEDQNMYD